MSKIKLVIEIDEENYKRIKDDIYDTHDIHRAIISIRRSTPFEMFDKIRAEIAELQKEYKEYGWVYDDALEVIDKYKAESDS